MLEKLLEKLPNQLPLGIVIVDKEDKIIFINEQAYQCLNLGRKLLINQDIVKLHDKDSHLGVKKCLDRCRGGEESQWQVYKNNNKYLKNICNGIFDEYGQYLGTVLMLLDITEQTLAQERLKRSHENLLALFDATKVINSSLDLDTVLEKILKLALEVSSLDRVAIYLKDKEKDDLILASGLPSKSMNPDECILTGANWSEATKRAIAGEPYHGHNDRLIPLQIGDKVIGLLHGYSKENFDTISDDSDILTALSNQAAIAIKNAMVYQEMSEMAIIDSLTQIYNRKHFYEVFAIESERIVREKRSMGVLMIDINHLKKINDSKGHLMGDFYIQEAANLIKEGVRKTDYVFRFGGDEILVLAPNISEEGLRKIDLRIRSLVENWNLLHSAEEIPLSVSIGWALATKEDELTGVVEKADARMYKDKRRYYCEIEDDTQN